MLYILSKQSKKSNLRSMLLWRLIPLIIFSFAVLAVNIITTNYSYNNSFSLWLLIEQVGWQILFIFITICLFIFLFNWLIIGQILKPIEKLREGALIFGEGNFHYRINYKANNELDDLIKSFNTMAAETERLVGEIVEKQKTISRQKDDFVFIAAHELRIPVTAIRWMLDDVLTNPKRYSIKELRQTLEKAFRANERLVQLISDLLEVSRSESGRLKIAIKPVAIKSTINTALSELDVLAKKKNQEIHYNPSFGRTVLADEEKLEEIINNLVSNAIKYTKEDGRIDIWHDEDNDTITTHVKDNGCGIPETAQAHLFQKFYRAETETTKSIQGTGLGLFITKELISRMNGHIWLESHPGLGSIFSFSLPKVTEEKRIK